MVRRCNSIPWAFSKIFTTLLAGCFWNQPVFFLTEQSLCRSPADRQPPAGKI